jgi:DNA-binding response OmpR family regulator
MAKILVVDDDTDLVEACRLVLEKEGHVTASAGNTRAGMKTLKDFSPDLLILDVMMEGPDDGIVMAQELRRTGFSKPILMFTSLSKVTGMSYGKDKELVPVDYFMEKPVDPETLVKKVEELLKGKEA